MKPQLEAHEVRVHQQFLNEDLWPVTAVYEYAGETPEHYETGDVAGLYEFVNHGRKTDGEMIRTELVTLGEDGSVSGAVNGTWEKKDSGRGYDFLTMKLKDVTYKGFFFRQHKEDSFKDTAMTFSAIGDDNTCIWGSMTGSDNGSMLAGMAAESLNKVILEAVKGHGKLPEEYMGCGISWKSSDESAVTSDGQVLSPREKIKVDLTAVITSGDVSIENTYHVTVKP